MTPGSVTVWQIAPTDDAPGIIGITYEPEDSDVLLISRPLLEGLLRSHAAQNGVELALPR